VFSSFNHIANPKVGIVLLVEPIFQIEADSTKTTAVKGVVAVKMRFGTQRPTTVAIDNRLTKLLWYRISVSDDFDERLKISQ
jgi:hypothetical protein